MLMYSEIVLAKQWCFSCSCLFNLQWLQWVHSTRHNWSEQWWTTFRRWCPEYWDRTTVLKWRHLVFLCSSYSWHVMVLLSASSECQPIEMPVLWEAPGAGMHGQWEETSCEGKLDVVMSRKSRHKKKIQSISTGMFEMESAWPWLCPSYTV